MGFDHNVPYHQTGSKRLHHSTVDALELDYEVMQLSADSGLLLAVFSAEPGSRSAAALDLLASWAATPTGLGAGRRSEVGRVRGATAAPGFQGHDPRAPADRPDHA